jgi:hypothetical protein
MPVEDTLRPIAARKRNAARRHEQQAAQYHAEADRLEEQWREYVARRDGKSKRRTR